MTRIEIHIRNNYRTLSPDFIASFLNIPIDQVTDNMNREGWVVPDPIEDEPVELFCWEKAKKLDFIFMNDFIK